MACRYIQRLVVSFCFFLLSVLCVYWGAWRRDVMGYATIHFGCLDDFSGLKGKEKRQCSSWWTVRLLAIQARITAHTHKLFFFLFFFYLFIFCLLARYRRCSALSPPSLFFPRIAEAALIKNPWAVPKRQAQTSRAIDPFLFYFFLIFTGCFSLPPSLSCKSPG
jgi:hypothetical protein